MCETLQSQITPAHYAAHRGEVEALKLIQEHDTNRVSAAYTVLTRSTYSHELPRGHEGQSIRVQCVIGGAETLEMISMVRR